MPLSGERESFEEASRRALNQPLAFDPTERSNYVKSMVNRTFEYMRQGMSIDDIKARLPEFQMNYSHLFDMITSPNGFDRGSLDTMLKMLDHMATGNLTQHNASVIVGKRLYEKFGRKDEENGSQ